LFRLKPKLAAPQDALLPALCRKREVRFVLSVEISTIYSKGGKVRKLHNLVVMPSFKAASRLNAALQHIGNLTADGRPILGLDSKRLLALALEADAETLFIPAHIWTPWFGMFGSRSGFDSVSEAFEELTPHIRAVETGLSSDPYMNWRVKQLDGITLVSHSDAHSPQKLGREANVLDAKRSYTDIRAAVVTGDKRFVGTIEFFPQEGKYHYDGHRLCGVRLAPHETKKLGGKCPKCGLPLVVGVDYRVDELADRQAGYKPKKKKSVEYIIPLPELIAEVKGVKNAQARSVMHMYESLGQTFGDEFTILRAVPVADIQQQGFQEIGESIKRMRAGSVVIEPGYDGVFGIIKVFSSPSHVQAVSGQRAML
jgi:DNA helicase-2/ATP-dependent DNA helicase PcrA